MRTKQHLLEQHGFPFVVIGAMVLVGFLVNNNNINSFNNGTNVISQDSTWCDTFEVLREAQVSEMPPGFEELTIVLSIILPIAPVLVNSLGLDDFKIEMLKSHFLGQSSSFGMSEIARHFATLPEAQFYKKCNLTFFDCKQKLGANLSLVSDDEDKSFCNTNSTMIDLLHSFHHFPASSGTLVGAAMASFIATLFYWHHLDKHNKSLYLNSPVKKYFLFLCIAIIVLVFIMYCMYLYKTFNSVEMYAVFFGAFLQVLIIVALLGQKEK